MPLDLEALHTADADDAAAFFAEADPESLVAAVAATSDDDLLGLIGRDEIRPAAILGILRRLHEYAVPERLGTLHGTVRIDLERRGHLLERHALRFTGGEIEIVDDPHGPVDVVLRTSVLRFVRLVSGERNAGLEYLSGKLDIEGDADLALAVGGIFRVPGTDGVAVDPTALDPVDVATALKHAPRQHLEKVMSSGFRPVVLGEIFRRLPEFVDPDRARGVEVAVGFRLLGNPSGEVERYLVRVSDGVATVTPGDEGEDRDATVTCHAHDYLRLATGHLNPLAGVVKGQLKVKGDRAKALQLSSVMNIPSPR
ncbi:SCP2 sterol-binding domain-containing protein [Nocardioides sp. T2.26MG-1]|uniref:SCP2 sterol-binding domain-containing protein n=1 Tax=Nocardioides sp. T2.26MG-1 TaxID=3041166 RepID=UPI002477A5B4|nr:SCP2 sterol-binding domain-containing protein [Nocardioides sp. T2.26MG-1]CAI9413615.1 Ubiquinone biosynthesis accessory factor UbiJ [Nocardioides sp. T2.26MG-1]